MARVANQIVTVCASLSNLHPALVPPPRNCLLLPKFSHRPLTPTADFAQYALDVKTCPKKLTTHWQRIATNYRFISGVFVELSCDYRVICGAHVCVLCIGDIALRGGKNASEL